MRHIEEGTEQKNMKNWRKLSSFSFFLAVFPSCSLDGRRPSRGCERVPQDEDDGVAAEEHLGDEAVAVHRLGLLLA